MKRKDGFESIDKNVAPLFQTEMPHFLSQKILFSDLLLSHYAYGVNTVTYTQKAIVLHKMSQ
jgi:hypothetical protein